MLKFPRGLEAILYRYFKTTQFDCDCSGDCNITEMDFRLLKVLKLVARSYKYPINIVKGYTCRLRGDTDQDIAHLEGRGLIVQSSDNTLLLKTLKKHKELTITEDGNNIFIIFTE